MHKTRPVDIARTSIAVLVVSLVLAAGCSASGEDSASESGWLDGSPAEADSSRRDGAEGASPSAADDSVSMASAGGEASSAAPGRTASGLRAGSVDDNEDFEGYLAYRDRAARLGVVSRELDVSERHVVEVRGDDGRPVLGEEVEVVADGKVVASVRTGTDGMAFVHPRALGIDDGATVTLRVDGVERAPDQSVPTTFELDRFGGPMLPCPSTSSSSSTPPAP